jgi:hypothetical protein
MEPVEETGASTDELSRQDLAPELWSEPRCGSPPAGGLASRCTENEPELDLFPGGGRLDERKAWKRAKTALQLRSTVRRRVSEPSAREALKTCFSGPAELLHRAS